ncbi:MAG: TetR/AcrR family transcriptional regulator [Lachnospiraceae bacterium]|nr:TetR/AcrR family transcriptional regulator [Lachnospiraceae bacterium]
MARKEMVSRSFLINTAFDMMCQEGLENVTARKLAARAGCSTQPIFRLYASMEDLWRELFELAVEYFEDYYKEMPEADNPPFVNLGIAYIRFAMEESHVFKMLFLDEQRWGKSLYEMLNGREGNLTKEINAAKAAGCKSTGELFTKMWIFIHGAACMSITGDYDLEEEETVRLLRSVYTAFSG